MLAYTCRLGCIGELVTTLTQFPKEVLKRFCALPIKSSARDDQGKSNQSNRPTNVNVKKRGRHSGLMPDTRTTSQTQTGERLMKTNESTNEQPTLARFPLGQTYITPGAQEALMIAG